MVPPPASVDQTTFAWFSDPNSADADDEGGFADYPLRGAERFQELPLVLPPGFTFYLGIHHASDIARCTVPWFISRRALVLNPATKKSKPADWPTLDRQRKSLPRSLSRGGIDSAGFTELNQFGCHHIPPTQYAAEVCRFVEEIGSIDFAAVQDWMCEEVVLRITGQDIDRHQKRTIESYMQLKSIAPNLPWAPVLQGFFPGDHERHLAMYYKNGIDLRCVSTVGVGSVCRRQGMVEADEIVRRLSGMDLKLHLFGYKFTGLPQTIRYVKSADSMAWSMVARKQWIQMPGHDHSSPSTGELWQRGARYGSLQRDDDGWRVRWDTSRPDERERVSSRATGREALERGGYRFVRLMWTCQNCLAWAKLWRNNMLALAMQGARQDHIARHYRHRALTADERAEWQEYDPTEQWGVRDLTRGDYEAARELMQKLSGVRVPRTPRCAPSTAPARQCVPARYQSPGEPPPQWPVPPRVRVVPLDNGPLEDFRPWSPSEETLLDARPAPFDESAVDELAREAAEETYDANDYAEVGYMDTPEMAWAYAAQRLDERLPASAAFQRFLTRLKGLTSSRRTTFSRRFRAAYEGELWHLYEAEKGEVGGEIPTTSPYWQTVLPASE